MHARRPVLILATSNKHKVREISLRLKGFNIHSLADFPGIPDIPETGSTFFDNAALKARAVFRRLKRPVLADDSGLIVNSLNGKPGVYSARYAGPHSTQKMLIKKLLKNMKNRKNRRAHFTTIMVYMDKNGRLHQATGKVYGRILDSQRGTNGFGYDPVFYYPPLKKTFAELSTREKNKVSHRIRALEKIILKIRNIDKSPEIA